MSNLLQRMAVFCFGAPKSDNEEFINHLVGKRITRLETRRRGKNIRVYCLEVEDGTNALLAGDRVEIREAGSSPTIWKQTQSGDTDA